MDRTPLLVFLLKGRQPEKYVTVLFHARRSNEVCDPAFGFSHPPETILANMAGSPLV
jgi:hypothetical protein